MKKTGKNIPRDRVEQRETDILEAATALFARDGFHKTSTRKIASSAGVSEGTLFHYFGTKNALLLAALDKFYEELTTSARDGVHDIMSTRERILFLAQNHLRALLHNNALLMRLLQVYLSVDTSYYTDYKNSHVHELNYRYTRIFDSVIREGIERGDLVPELELPAIRDLFFGGLEYGMRTLMGKNDTKNLDGYVQAIVDPLWNSMQPATSIASPSSKTLEQRLEQACVRLEQVAEKMETETEKT